MNLNVPDFKHAFLALCMLGFFFQAGAQVPDFEWAKGMGSDKEDLGNALCTDNQGNVYTTGFFQGVTDFGNGPVAPNDGKDIFVTKHNAAGNLQWVRKMGGDGNDEGQAIAVDASGNIYVTGKFQIIADFNPGGTAVTLQSKGFADVFIAKLNSAGDLQWVKGMGGSRDDQGKSIAVDAAGYIYTTGTFFDTLRFNQGSGVTELVTKGSIDVYVAKLNPAGDFIWAKNFGSKRADYVLSILVGGADQMYIAGVYEDTLDFKQGTGNIVSAGDQDGFVARLDTSGKLIWAKSIGGTDVDQVNSIALDPSGNVYASFITYGTINFPAPSGIPAISASGEEDIMFLKMSASGDFLWARSLASADEESESISRITTDAAGDLYITGIFQAPVDFDPAAGGSNTLYPTGGNDVFICKYDSKGDLVWAHSFGGTNSEVSMDISIWTSALGDINIHTTGGFRGTTMFDPGVSTSSLSSKGNSDIFIHKLRKPTCVTTGTLTESACASFTYDGTTYTSSGTYMHTFKGINAQGCDSVVTLHLNIQNTRDTITETACHEFTFNAVRYTVNGIYPHTFTNAAGCDSTVVLDLVVHTIDTSVHKDGLTLTANLANAGYQWIDCDNDNKILTGATGQALTVTSEGNYAVIISKNGCSDTSACVLAALSIADRTQDAGIRIFPNPGRGIFYVHAAGSLEQASLRVTSITGRTILNKTGLQGHSVHVDITTSPAGIYFVELVHGDRTVRTKLVKE